MNTASKRAKRARDLRARDSDCGSVTSTSTLDESRHRLRLQPSELSTTIKHIKYDPDLDEEKERDYLRPDQTDNGTNFTGVQVPEGAPTNLLCEECERRDSIAYCEDCKEVLCAACLAILHIPGTGGQAHAHLEQDAIRMLRAGDESTVIREDEDPIPAHEIDEEEMATRRDLSIPTSLEAPTIDLISRTSKSNSAVPLHSKGQLVVFEASLADSLLDHLAEDKNDNDNDEENDDGHGHVPSFRRRGSKPRELYGEVMSVPMARHGEWGNARRRMQGHRLLVRVKILGRASRGYAEPFVEEWLHRKHRREGPREPVKIVGGSGPDPLAREIGAAKVKDMRRDDIRRAFVPPEKELPLARPRLSEESSTTTTTTTTFQAAAGEGGVSQARENGTGLAGEEDDRQQPLVVLVAEDQLVSIEEKREALRRSRYEVVESCCKSAERRRKAGRKHAALNRWYDTTVNIRNERWRWASQVLQRRTRGTLVRLRRARQRQAEEKALWEAGRRLHTQFRYLNTQELREKAGGGVTTDGRVFVTTKAELNRLEALRRVMAERSFRMLCKGVYRVKVHAFKHWLRYTEWERRESETYIFSVAKDTSLAGDQPVEAGPCETDWRHPSHGITLSPLPRVYSGRLGVNTDDQTDPVAAASMARKMMGPAPFCSWLMPGLVLMSSYIHSEAKARPRDFKQPLYPDAASQMMIAGVGTLVGLCSEGAVRQHESDNDLPKFEQPFVVSHKIISASIKVSMGEAKHEVTMLRQEENNLALLRSVEGYDQEERRKALAEIVGRMRIARSAYTVAKRAEDLFPRELKVTWEPLPEDEAPGVDEVVELAMRLEGRLRAGEKLCLWSPRGHGRVGLVGAVLLGRLYGCTAEDALLRVQVCHDAKESLKGQPQISCPQTIAQVQCVREALLQMSSIYTDLVMRADLPASNRGTKICQCTRGGGPPSLRQSERVADETQAARYERERKHRRQIDTIQDDHQPDLLFPDTSASTIVQQQSKHALYLEGGGSKIDAFVGMENYSGRRNKQLRGTSSSISGRSTKTRIADNNGCSTTVFPPPRKFVTLGSYKGGLGAGGDEVLLLPPASFGKGSSTGRPVASDRARAVAAVPYPTMRSLRKS